VTSISLWKSLWRNLFRKQRVERDLDDELAAYFGLLVEERMYAGLSREEAVRQARIEMGGAEQVKEEVRDVRIGTKLESIRQDVRFGARLLAKAPTFSVIAILTLAVGIGANTAIFSVVHAVLLKGLPYPAADRLAIVLSTWGKEARGPASGPELIELRRRSQLFEEIGGIWVTAATLTGVTEPEQLSVGQVTANFLPLLAEKPQLGRFFSPDEQHSGGPPVVILTDGVWRSQFGADRGIIGRSIRLYNADFTVVGVMAPDFRLLFPDDVHVPPDVQVFIPFFGDLEKQSRTVGFIRTIARLRKGATIAQARSEAERIAGELRSSFKEFADQGLHLQVNSLHEDDVRNVRPAIVALFGGVGFVLLISCANVANLLLARASRRHRETALRAALGAPRSRIVRQLLTENLLLGAFGGLAAVGVGWALLKSLLALKPAAISRMGSIDLNAPVLAFTLGVSLLTGILFGLAPALGSAKINLIDVLKEGARNATLGRRRSGGLLVAGEVALGLLLLIGTGLMLRTFLAVLRVDPGFNANQAMTFQLALPGSLFESKTASKFVRDLRANLAAIPGVKSVGMVSHLPLSEGQGNWYSYYWREGAPAEEQNTVMADHRSTSPGYFQSIGATLVAGRDFTDLDDVDHPRVAIVDDLLAEKTWPNQDPLGKKLNIEDSPAGPFAFTTDLVEVVGVVRHVQYHSLTNNVRGQVYLPFPLAPRPQVSFVVRTATPPASLIGSIRQVVSKLNKDMPVSRAMPLADYVEAARSATRFVTLLSVGLAGTALLLACIGIYGVTGYSVAQRTPEIGVRMALGAQRWDVLRMVLRQSSTPIALGLATGLVLSFAVTPLLASLLFGIRPIDVWSIAGSIVVLCATGLAACYLPARRAMRVDPIAALRYE
jgi:predicted permease